MGLTPHPPEYSRKGIQRAFAFLRDHGDLAVHHFDAGVPWEEALQGTEFSDHLRADWQRRTRLVPATHKVYVAITPLDIARDGMAPYWGRADNLDLPEDWRGLALDDPRVKTAYLQYAQRIIQYFEPDYLAVGVEVNMLIARAPELWPHYLALHRYLYTQLKQQHPQLPIFATIQYDWLRGLEEGSEASVAQQLAGVEQLLQVSDLVALSTYKYGARHNPLSPDFFELAARLGKPIVVSEAGALSRPLTLGTTTLDASEVGQAEYLAFLLREARQRRFLFVVNFIGIDYDRLYQRIARRLPPQMRRLFSIWVSTGLETAKGRAKPALAVWDAYRQLTYVRE